jgi:hypothetical protein
MVEGEQMTGAWNSAAKTLVILSALCVGGLVVCRLFASSDNFPESLAITMAVSACALVVAASGLAGVYLAVLHLRLRTHLSRPPLSDEEFLAALPGNVSVDLEVIRRVRRLAAQWLLPNDGERVYRVYPDDRLEDDLYLSDLAPGWGRHFFWRGLSEYIGCAQRDLMARRSEIVTFGDVVVLADRLRRATSVQ